MRDHLQTVSDLAVEVGELEVEKAAGKAAEAEVRAEACRAGQQRVGVHPGALEVSHPGLEQDRQRERNTGWEDG